MFTLLLVALQQFWDPLVPLVILVRVFTLSQCKQHVYVMCLVADTTLKFQFMFVCFCLVSSSWWWWPKSAAHNKLSLMWHFFTCCSEIVMACFWATLIYQHLFCFCHFKHWNVILTADVYDQLIWSNHQSSGDTHISSTNVAKWN